MGLGCDLAHVAAGCWPAAMFTPTQALLVVHDNVSCTVLWGGQCNCQLAPVLHPNKRANIMHTWILRAVGLNRASGILSVQCAAKAMKRGSTTVCQHLCIGRRTNQQPCVSTPCVCEIYGHHVLLVRWRHVRRRCYTGLNRAHVVDEEGSILPPANSVAVREYTAQQAKHAHVPQLGYYAVAGMSTVESLTVTKLQSGVAWTCMSHCSAVSGSQRCRPPTLPR